MDVFQNLITLDIQVAAMMLTNIISGFSLSGVCKHYTYLSYYLTFLQTMFMIKVNTSLNPVDVWWFNWFWCLVLYSFIISIPIGVFEFMCIEYVERIPNNRIVNILMKVIYCCLILMTALIPLLICDPDKC